MEYDDWRDVIAQSIQEWTIIAAKININWRLNNYFIWSLFKIYFTAGNSDLTYI